MAQLEADVALLGEVGPLELVERREEDAYQLFRYRVAMRSANHLVLFAFTV